MIRVHKFSVERIDVTSKRPYEGVRAALEASVPSANLATLTQLVTTNADARQIEHAVNEMVGDLGFMLFAKIDQGPLVSRLGQPKKMSVYLLGNPVLANRMYEQDRAVGLYAPLRVSIYEDPDGITTHFSYDLPSSLLEQFSNGEMRAVGRVLDDKMATLAARVTDGSNP